MNMDQELIEKAGECGFRPIIMMLGSISDKEVNVEVNSYEGPFGVGYATVVMKVKETAEVQ